MILPLPVISDPKNAINLEDDSLKSTKNGSSEIESSMQGRDSYEGNNNMINEEAYKGAVTDMSKSNKRSFEKLEVK